MPDCEGMGRNNCVDMLINCILIRINKMNYI